MQQELPEAQLSITGPDVLVAQAAFDPLRLSALLVLACALACAFPRLLRVTAAPRGSAMQGSATQGSAMQGSAGSPGAAAGRALPSPP